MGCHCLLILWCTLSLSENFLTAHACSPAATPGRLTMTTRTTPAADTTRTTITTTTTTTTTTTAPSTTTTAPSTTTTAPSTTTTAMSFELEYRGEVRFPNRQVLTTTDVPFGGISGITYDSFRNRYYIISDDRTNSGARVPRFYYLNAKLSVQNGWEYSDLSDPITLDSVSGGGNTPFADGAVDPEDIAWDPVNTGTAYWVNEGGSGGVPEIRAMSIKTEPYPTQATIGNLESVFMLPDYYTPAGSVGCRDNLCLESLTITPDGLRLVTANEQSLMQDGSESTTTTPGVARILFLDTTTRQPAAEYAYNIDPISLIAVPAGSLQSVGLVGLAAVNSTTFLSMERSAAFGVGFRIRIYRFSITGATDVLNQSPLPAGVTPVNKTLIQQIDNGSIPGLDIDNIEGITFGPNVDGMQSVILVTDDNFLYPLQRTQFLFFTLSL